MSKQEKVCIVTGVGPDKGTGAEIAKLFGRKNYKVAMIARNKENLDNLEKKYNNIFSYPCDVSNIQKFKTTLENIKSKLGPANVVIHNAPSASRGSILDLNSTLDARSVYCSAMSVCFNTDFQLLNKEVFPDKKLKNLTDILFKV